MSAIMIVLMEIDDASWMAEYFSAVPQLLSAYGAKAMAAGRDIEVLEVDTTPPDRVAVLSFPDLATLRRFMADERYARFRQAREEGSRSTILIMPNEIGGDTAFA